jgi:hypothetical protein
MFGYRGGWGFGFRGSSPPWPYVGRGRGGLPRCSYFFGQTGAPLASGYTPVYGRAWDTPYAPTPFSPQMTSKQDLEFLRSEAEAIKEQLEKIEARIGELETEVL